MKRIALAGGAVACLAAQSLSHAPSLNEIYVAHAGTNDQEFVELEWDGGGLMTGLMLVVVDGDAGEAGILDLAIDLVGQSVPLDNYFVLGTAGTANLDMNVGASDVFENGTQTIYLISASNVPAVMALVGTNIDPDGNLLTELSTMESVFIIDSVGINDGGVGDRTYDFAQVLGPDGSSMPAGIFRGDDAPNGWCTDTFLDFNLAGDRTPGARNISCPAVAPGSGFCDGSAGNCPCAVTGAVGQGCPNTNPNGNGALLVGTGTAEFSNDTLGFTISDGPFSKAGILIQGAAALGYPNGNANVPNASGIFCVNPMLRGNVFFTDGSGNATVTNFQGQPFGASAQPLGSTTYYQYWFRDPGNACQNAPASAAAFNFSNGYEIDWN